MSKLPVDMNNEEWGFLLDEAIKKNPGLLSSLSPDPALRLQQLDQYRAEGRLIIRPKKPKTKRIYRTADWKDWLVYFVLCQIAGIHMEYEDLAHDMLYNPVDRYNYPMNVQTIKNKFKEILSEYK
jgi:hypothetical protein